jgi:hypothetical protein
MEVVVAAVLPDAEGVHANEANPWSGDVASGDVSAHVSLGGMLGFGGVQP